MCVCGFDFEWEILNSALSEIFTGKTVYKLRISFLNVMNLFAIEDFIQLNAV